MRMLFLTNFYPPASRGGYEQWCQEVAEVLRNRGHDVVVLTSRHGQTGLALREPTWIVRKLYLEMELASLRNGIQFFTHRHRRERANLVCLRQMIANYQPDVVVVWGMWNLPRSLPALAEILLPQRVAYYMGDYWPTLPNQFTFYWQEPAQHWASAFPKRLLGTVARCMLMYEKMPWLEFPHVMFPTAFLQAELQRQGIVPKESVIIAGAVDTAPYADCVYSTQRSSDEALSLLYVGRLAAEKGVHTIIKALGHLINQGAYKRLKLTIVGAGDADYEAWIRDLIAQEKIQAYVTLLGMQPKEAVPTFYAQADVFLFASIWPEPFGRVLVEAMAAGLAVVGTATGGAAEILMDEENALIFPPEDVPSLVTQLERLIKSVALRQRLAYNGRERAIKKFDIQRMVAEIETFLQAIVKQDGMISCI